MIISCLSLHIHDEPAFSLGRIVGNGGMGVKCVQKGETNIRVLDVYEFEVFRQKEWDFADQRNTSIFDQAKEYLERLTEIDPNRTKILTANLEELKNRYSVVSNLTLESTADSGFVPLQDGCELIQIAVFVKESWPGDPVLFISQEYWDQLDQNNKAALFVHEVLFKHLTDQGVENSRSTRYWVGQLLSNEIEKFDEKVKYYYQTLKDTGFKEFSLPFPKLSKSWFNIDQVEYIEFNEAEDDIERIQFKTPFWLEEWEYQKWGGYVCFIEIDKVKEFTRFHFVKDHYYTHYDIYEPSTETAPSKNCDELELESKLFRELER